MGKGADVQTAQMAILHSVLDNKQFNAVHTHMNNMPKLLQKQNT